MDTARGKKGSNLSDVISLHHMTEEGLRTPRSMGQELQCLPISTMFMITGSKQRGYGWCGKSDRLIVIAVLTVKMIRPLVLSRTCLGEEADLRMIFRRSSWLFSSSCVSLLHFESFLRKHSPLLTMSKVSSITKVKNFSQ